MSHNHVPERAQADPRQRRTLRKVVAGCAAGSVLGIGAITTLATWNDSEWIFGGADEAGGPLTTGRFEIWQNRLLDGLTAVPVAGASETEDGWEDQPTSPGGGLNFTVDTPQLSPGTTLYAPVALQAKADSDAGTVVLQGATNTDPDAATNDPDGALWGAVRVTVLVTETAPATTDYCDASFTGTAVLDNVTPGTAATLAQDIDTQRGNVQYYCFRLTLPDSATLIANGVADPNTLQGRAIRPTWEFVATSLA